MKKLDSFVKFSDYNRRLDFAHYSLGYSCRIINKLKNYLSEGREKQSWEKLADNKKQKRRKRKRRLKELGEEVRGNRSSLEPGTII